MTTWQGRQLLAKTFRGFCLTYLPHYFNKEPATFHETLSEEVANEKNKYLEIIGFRGSAKSTIATLAFPIYAALKQPERYPFIIVVADTSMQVGINIANIKNELENNELIRHDFGNIESKFVNDLPMLYDDKDEWQSKNLLLSNGVRILGRSRGQKVRGLRHKQYRPSIVIIDDPEDLEWVRLKENRDKTERWLMSEVVPGIDEQDGRVIVIGNWLHTDALLSRIKKGGMFKCLEYPLMDDKGNVTWPAKYPTKEDIERQKNLICSSGPSGVSAWNREYLLKVVPDEGQEVTETDISYYDKEPSDGVMGLIGTGVDPAISKKETADYTAMVTAKCIWVGDVPKIYIQPNPIHERLDVKETIANVKAIAEINKGNQIFYVEGVAYQQALIELLEQEMLSITPVHPLTDKRARLKIITNYIKNGTVLFPRQGCEDLLIELLGFGIEAHDDLVDALVMCVAGLTKDGMMRQEVVWL